MGVLADGLLVATGVFGLACCVLGYEATRRDAPGATAFGWFLYAWGVLPFVVPVPVFQLPASTRGLVWCLGTIPWVLFTLQYTGTAFGRRSVLAVTAPIAGFLPSAVASVAGWGTDVAGTVVLFVYIYYTGIGLVGAALVLQTSTRYDHVPLRRGVVVAAVGVIPQVTMNVFGILSPILPALTVNGILAAGFAGVTLVAGAAMTRYGMFDATPAPGVIGDRTLAAVTDELVIVTDREERPVNLNPAAATAFGDPSLPAETVGDVVGVELSKLREAETVEVRTETGTRTFDSSVTPLADQHDDELGYLVSLHDVTDREIRRQRLEVLNRIMRHNVRNRTTVVRGNAEWVATQLDDDEFSDRLNSAAGAAESLAALSRKTKRIETILSRDSDRTTVFDVADAVADAVPAAVSSVRVDGGRIDGDEELVAFIVETLAKTAADRGEAVDVRVTVGSGPLPVTVAVETDGEGLSAQEIDVIRSGTEDPLNHASGIDLWVANWAVTDCGGELAFDDDGRVIRVALPFQPVDPTATRTDDGVVAERG